MRWRSSRRRAGTRSSSPEATASIPLMKLRLSEPKDPHRHRAHPWTVRHSREGRPDRNRRGHDARRSRVVLLCCGRNVRWWRMTAAEIGDPQVRNRGTLGGSLAHADPSADYPAAMLAVDAEIHLKGPKGLAGRESRRLLPGPVHRESGGGRNHRRRAVCAGRRPPPTPSSTSARRTSRSSASRRRSTSPRARSGPPVSG